jgi:hypothetical protein
VETSAIQFGCFWSVAELRHLIPTAQFVHYVHYNVGASFPVTGVE